jgi:hypothetical protein
MAGAIVSVPGSHGYDLTVHGHDTIHLGRTTTVHELAHSSVAGSGAFAQALSGVEPKLKTHSDSLFKTSAVIGRMTVVGGSADTEFVGGGRALTHGVDTLAGATGHDTMFGAKGAHVLEFLNTQHGSAHLTQDFVSGHEHLYLEGHSLASLKSSPDSSISSHGGNTYITLDGGKTTIELHGVTHLKPSDITPNKH